MMEILQSIESSGFSMFVKESSTAYVTMLAFHTVGLAFLVGISVATSMRVLGAARTLPLAPLEDLFPLMYAGFWINAATGVVLLSLYPTKQLTDATIYIKLGAVLLAMVAIRMLRGLVFGASASFETAEGAKKAKMLSCATILLWLVAIVAGRVTAYSLPTKLQTAGAVLVAGGLMLLVGFVGGRTFGWFKSSDQGA